MEGNKSPGLGEAELCPWPSAPGPYHFFYVRKPGLSPFIEFLKRFQSRELAEGHNVQ